MTKGHPRDLHEPKSTQNVEITAPLLSHSTPEEAKEVPARITANFMSTKLANNDNITVTALLRKISLFSPHMTTITDTIATGAGSEIISPEQPIRQCDLEMICHDGQEFSRYFIEERPPKMQLLL